MKLNKRESVLITILLAFILIYLLFTFLFKPALNELIDADNEIANKQNNLQNINNQISQLKNINNNNEEQAILDEIKTKGEKLLPSLKNKEIMNYLGSLTTEMGINVTKINVQGMKMVNLKSKSTSKNQIYTAGALAANIELLKSGEEVTGKLITADPLNLMVESIPAQVSFSSTNYTSVMAFIKRVEGLNKTILIDGIDLSLTTASNVQGTISITFYGLCKVDGEASPIEFTAVAPAAKANPFG